MENCSIVCLNGKQVNVYAHFVCLRLTVCLLQVTKAQVDSYNFMPKQQIPSCQLMAVWNGKSKPSRLIHKVTLEGAKKPFNYLRIVLDCDIISPTGILTLMMKSLGGQCILTTSLTLLLFHTDDNILHPC